MTSRISGPSPLPKAAAAAGASSADAAASLPTTTGVATTLDEVSKLNKEPPPASDRLKQLSMHEALLLIDQADAAIEDATEELEDARALAARYGFSLECSIVDPMFQSPLALAKPLLISFGPPTVSVGATAETGNIMDILGVGAMAAAPDSNRSTNGGGGKTSFTRPPTVPPVLTTTGGHSNTDHVISQTGDAASDRIAELKRALKRRAKMLKPEQRGENTWDQPRVVGGRRRRIARETSAPMEPPLTGYILFVAQMTVKIRNDRPGIHHNQIKAVHEISKIWNSGMSKEDKDYYITFVREAREEYLQQQREYRATGRFTPSTTFTKLEGGPWVRTAYHEKNALEREISSYESFDFPPRPPEMDKAYEMRMEESKRRRKEREKAKVLRKRKKGI